MKRKQRKSTQKHAQNVHSHKEYSEEQSKVNKRVSNAKKDSTSTIKNVAIAVLLLALVSVVWWSFSNQDTTPNTPTAGIVTGEGTVQRAPGNFNIPTEIQSQMTELAADDPFLGAADAPVVIVEFSDYQCGFCGRFHTQTLPLIKEKFVDTGYVKFVYRDLPFQPNAQKAAEAAHCAREQGKFWEYNDKLLTNQQALAVNNLKAYAVDLGLDTTQFNTCLDTSKYATQVQASAQTAQTLGISGTPGFIINGRSVSGAQPYDRFEQIICSIIPQATPCAEIEPPVKLGVTVITHSDCTSCTGEIAQLQGVFMDLFPGAEFTTIDAQSAEGKVLIDKHELVFAPSYLFAEELTETNTWKTNAQLQNAFMKVDGGYRVIDEAVEASYYLSDEVREAQLARVQESLGLTTGDNTPQVDYFLMSYCPYGDQAEELLKPVFDQLKGQAKFVPRYVIYSQGNDCYTDTDGTQLCSLRGGVELNQNVRELCVYNNYGEQEWFDFALAMNNQCDSNNADTCWTAVAQGLGLDTDMISSCFDDNKLAYAREQYELTRMLGVTGSPTVFFEGTQYNGARSSNGYLAALCEGFDQKPSACDNVVAEPVPTAASSGAQC
jgi:protein-disulfide isomerase